MSSSSIYWHKTLEDFFGVRLVTARGNISDVAKLVRWNDEIKTAMPNITQEDIVNALRWASTKFSRNSNKARPDLAEVINMVRAYRGEQHHTSGIPATVILDQTTRATTTMSDLKFRLKRCHNPVQAWEIICSPVYNVEQSQELERYAKEQKIPYERFIPETDYDNLAKQIAEVIDESEEVPF